MIVGQNYYSWQPNPVSVRDPETSDLSGNVLGDISKAEKVDLVVKAGDLYSLEVRETSEMYKRILGPEANRSFQLVDNMTDVYEHIVAYYRMDEPEIDPEDEYEPAEYTIWEPNPNLTGVPSMTDDEEEEQEEEEQEEEEQEETTAVEVEGESFNWAIVNVSIKDPETGDRFGNIIGDLSKQEQIARINRIGDGYQLLIQQDSEYYKNLVAPEAAKRIAVKTIMADVFDALAEHFDYEEVITDFVLDSSELDVGILG